MSSTPTDPDAQRWAKRFVPRPDASLRLLCFPHAGAGAGSFRRLAVALPAWIETLPIEYPGRWTRADEAPADSVIALAEGAAAALGPITTAPYAVLGCSFGALVAYEFIRTLAASGRPLPRAFLPCAQRAPHLPLLGPPLHALPDASLMAAMERRYGAGPTGPLEDPKLLALALRPLRADLRARESYSWKAGKPLTVPIHAFGGDDDLSVEPDGLEAWRLATTGPFTVRRLRGDHFFFTRTDGPFTEAVTESLLQSAAEEDRKAG